MDSITKAKKKKKKSENNNHHHLPLNNSKTAMDFWNKGLSPSAKYLGLKATTLIMEAPLFHYPTQNCHCQSFF